MGQGITWDEPIYVEAGIQDIHNIQHLDFSSDAWVANYEHPTFSKYLYGIVTVVFNNGNFNYRAFVVSKTLSALMGAVTCVLAYLIGREFLDRKTGFAAAIILALIPTFVAHNQQAAIDTPLALIFTITIFLFMLAVKNHSIKYYIASAVSLGVLIDTKFNGLLILPIMALFYLMYRYMEWQHGEKIDKKNIARTAAYAIGFIFIAGLTLYALWPWVWNSPTNLQLSLQHWDFTPQEYFLGTLQGPTLIYYPVYFLVTTPALLLIPFFIGVYSFARSKDLYKYGILLWCFIPFLYDFSNVVMNGMRYILMIYPAVALLCAAGIVEVATWVTGMKIDERVKKAAFPMFLALTVVYMIFSLSTVCPYYLDYYNELTGGPANVEEHNLFIIGWWGEGLYDSVMYLEHNAAPHSVVYVAAEPHTTAFFYGSNNTYDPGNIYLGSETEYAVTNVMSDNDKNVTFDKSDYRLIYETKVDNASLAKVYKNIHIT